MRSEQEIFDLILGVANKDERVRAVYMNGSRTNPHAPKDIFQDYDFVYVVTEIASFLRDENWIDIFGERLMIQEADKMDRAVGIDVNIDRTYIYLMLFADGNRIDLRLQTKEAMLETYMEDSLTAPLLDKDNILPSIPAPTDSSYYVKKPTEAEFMNCCNEFWWCQQNVAKGIWRDELPYAKHMYEFTSRAPLDEMVSWWIGIKHHNQVSTGKMGKYFKMYLPTAYWDMYKATYSDANYENMWNSIFVTCELFRTLALEVAATYSYTYRMNDDTNMTAYLERVRDLPMGAKEIY
ncbi:aminoglycoside 6-adenylyltransferase [Paenibacillus sp. SC116]|uniref:aminoglycoside 6-adenylyltransferase n=1 Tax=Paenibacillus sp. SC116 TaxID=2968986 RepID=UPI00215AB106|nr:aminoglycoside 6-adenylyltransferase [Paenibacillus sp. SC116]MCR8842225.1 aminoglycoside 6-adenylyltransferase [Paenibacillus sp. SC116]